MPKRKIQWLPGGYYHMYNRGAARQPIFHSEENYLYLLRLMKNVAQECEVSILAYCLLPNHYHWLVRQNGHQPAQRLPKRVFGSYTQAFNRQQERSGTLFEGPYQAIQITCDEYLRQLCRYIHANPVRHGLVPKVEQWPYSNYLECIGRRQGALGDRDFVGQFLGTPAAYAAAVNAYIDGQVPLPVELTPYLGESG